MSGVVNSHQHKSKKENTTMDVRIPNHLKRAIADAEKALADRRKIEDAIAQAVSLQPAVELQLRAAFEELGTEEAEMVHGTTSRSSRARSNLQAARDKADGLAARISALQRRLTTQEADVLAAFDALRGAWEKFAHQVATDWRKEFLGVAEVFLDVVRGGVGLGDGLGIQFIGLEGTQICDPESGMVLPLFESPIVNGQRQYHQHPKANSARASVASAKDALDECERVANSIMRARQEREAKPTQRPSQSAQPGIVSGGYDFDNDPSTIRQRELIAGYRPPVRIVTS
jgi:hypothetical protein